MEQQEVGVRDKYLFQIKRNHFNEWQLYATMWFASRADGVANLL